MIYDRRHFGRSVWELSKFSSHNRIPMAFNGVYERKLANGQRDIAWYFRGTVNAENWKRNIYVGSPVSPEFLPFFEG